MLREPVLELVLALQLRQRQLVVCCSRVLSYAVQGLYVFDVLLDMKLKLLWQGVFGNASSAGA